MAISLTMDYLYHLSLDKLSRTIGSFALYSSNTLLTREHLCKHLPNTTLHLFYTSDGPQFSSPTSFPGLHSLICLQYAQTHPTPSPVTSPDRPQVYQYLLTGALGRNFAILPTPTLQALRTYLLRHFGTDNFTYSQSNRLVEYGLTQHTIELRTPLQGGCSIQIKGLFGTRYISPATLTLNSITDCLHSLFAFTSIYCVQQGKILQHSADPYFPIYVLGRLRGGTGNVPPIKNTHQTTAPPEKANKLRRQGASPATPPQEIGNGSSLDDQMAAGLSTDEKLLLILKETKANRPDSKKLASTVRSLENEMSSSSQRLDAVEDQIGQLQGELDQLRVNPDSKTDPPSRRSSVDTTNSTLNISPEVLSKKLRTLYFRGFPINTREHLLHWMKQQELPTYEEIYTLGSPTDTAVVLLKNDTDLWTFLCKCPNNKWLLFESQIYVALDKQVRGQNPEHTKAIRKLYRACIQIMSEKYPDSDVAQTYIYRNYNRGVVKIKNGSIYLG